MSNVHPTTPSTIDLTSTTTYVPTTTPSPITMAEFRTPAASAPRWVTDLTNPPAYKSKNSNIADPPGYPPSQAIQTNKARLPL